MDRDGGAGAQHRALHVKRYWHVLACAACWLRDVQQVRAHDMHNDERVWLRSAAGRRWLLGGTSLWLQPDFKCCRRWCSRLFFQQQPLPAPPSSHFNLRDRARRLLCHVFPRHGGRDWCCALPYPAALALTARVPAACIVAMRACCAIDSPPPPLPPRHQAVASLLVACCPRPPPCRAMHRSMSECHFIALPPGCLCGRAVQCALCVVVW